MVMRLPERDQLSVTREKMHADIAVAMGGRIDEEIIFCHDKVTSGASSDIDMVTKMAKNMVTKYGMSKELGTIAYGENEEEVFLGRSVTKQQNMSEETAKKVDEEVKKIVDRQRRLVLWLCRPAFPRAMVACWLKYKSEFSECDRRLEEWRCLHAS